MPSQGPSVPSVHDDKLMTVTKMIMIMMMMMMIMMVMVITMMLMLVAMAKVGNWRLAGDLICFQFVICGCVPFPISNNKF